MRWDDPADDPDYINRTRKIVADLAPWVGQGSYVDMLNFDEMDRVVEAFGDPEKYARLGRLRPSTTPGTSSASTTTSPQPADSEGPEDNGAQVGVGQGHGVALHAA
jgi:hypothetical protein